MRIRWWRFVPYGTGRQIKLHARDTLHLIDKIAIEFFTRIHASDVIRLTDSVIAGVPKYLVTVLLGEVQADVHSQALVNFSSSVRQDIQSQALRDFSARMLDDIQSQALITFSNRVKSAYGINW